MTIYSFRKSESSLGCSSNVRTDDFTLTLPTGCLNPSGQSAQDGSPENTEGRKGGRPKGKEIRCQGLGRNWKVGEQTGLSAAGHTETGQSPESAAECGPQRPRFGRSSPHRRTGPRTRLGLSAHRPVRHILSPVKPDDDSVGLVVNTFSSSIAPWPTWVWTM